MKRIFTPTSAREDAALRFDSPRGAGAGGGFFSSYFFYLPLVLLGISGAFGCLYTAFPIPLSAKTPALASLTCAAAAALFLLPRRLRLAFAGLSLSAWGIFLFRYRELLLEGLFRTVNVILEAYSKKSKFEFVTMPVAGAFPASESCTAFAMLMLAPSAVLLAWLLIRRGGYFRCFILTLLFALVPLAYTIIPAKPAIWALLLFWTFLLFRAPLRTGKRARPDVVVFGAPPPTPAGLLPLVPLAAFLALMTLAFPQESYHRPDAVNRVRGELIGKPLLSPLFQNDRLGETLNGIDLRAVGNLAFTGETVLRVRTTGQGTEYLKGHVGSVYTGNSWQPLGTDAAGELDRLLDGYKAQNFYGMFASLEGQADVFTLSVENVAAARRGVYIPYGLISGPEELSGMAFVDDAYVRAGSLFFVDREYQLRAVPAGTERSPAGTYDADWDFAAAAEAYSGFVNGHYRQVPENLRPFLTQYLADHGVIPGQYGPRTTAAAIIRAVQRENVYTLSPGNTPEGRDFVEYFLAENHRGYCMHFASAVTALLRAAGVPARFAEGYALLAEEAGDPEAWVDIPDSRAHAWPEIYVDGLGWIPVEATPGGGAPVPPAAGLTDNAEPPVPPETPERAPSSMPEGAPSGPEDAITAPGKPGKEPPGHPGAQEPEDGPGGIPAAVWWAAGAGMLCAFAWGQRRLRKRFREKAYAQKGGNRAALAVCGHLIPLYDYARAHADRFPELPETVTDLWLKARYSQHVLTEQEVAVLLDYDAALMEEARKRLPPLRRLLCEYVFALL